MSGTKLPLPNRYTNQESSSKKILNNQKELKEYQNVYENENAPSIEVSPRQLSAAGNVFDMLGLVPKTEQQEQQAEIARKRANYLAFADVLRSIGEMVGGQGIGVTKLRNRDTRIDEYLKEADEYNNMIQQRLDNYNKERGNYMLNNATKNAELSANFNQQKLAQKQRTADQNTSAQNNQIQWENSQNVEGQTNTHSEEYIPFAPTRTNSSARKKDRYGRTQDSYAVGYISTKTNRRYLLPNNAEVTRLMSVIQQAKLIPQYKGILNSINPTITAKDIVGQRNQVALILSQLEDKAPSLFNQIMDDVNVGYYDGYTYPEQTTQQPATQPAQDNTQNWKTNPK
jgi:hypothetical protein